MSGMRAQLRNACLNHVDDEEDVSVMIGSPNMYNSWVMECTGLEPGVVLVGDISGEDCATVDLLKGGLSINLLTLQMDSSWIIVKVLFLVLLENCEIIA